MSHHGAHGHGDDPDAGMHLPHGSWWPFWLAMAITLFGIGLVMLGQDLRITPLDQAAAGDPFLSPVMPGMLSLTVLGLGTLAVVGALLGWFTQDYHWWREKLGTGTHIPKAGALLFISSEVFLFGALFTNYFSFQHLAESTGAGWPDVQGEFHLPIVPTTIFTLFLFASSATVHMAEHHIKRGNHKAFNNWWLLTIILGAIFLAGQVYEYASLIQSGHTLGTSQFMTAFFILTGTHGLHVFAGLVMLVVVQVRGRLGQFDEKRHAAPQVASMYWHFVDIVWVFVFAIVYLMNL